MTAGSTASPTSTHQEPLMATVLRCAACQRLAAPPRELCPHCHAGDLMATTVAGAGMLLSWTVIRRPPQAFRDEGPYAVGVIALDAGVPVTARVAMPEGSGDLPVGSRMIMVGEHGGAAVFRVA